MMLVLDKPLFVRASCGMAGCSMGPARFSAGPNKSDTTRARRLSYSVEARVVSVAGWQAIEVLATALCGKWPLNLLSDLQNHVKPEALLVKADGTTEIQPMPQAQPSPGSGTRGRRLSYVTNDVSKWLLHYCMLDPALLLSVPGGQPRRP